MPSMLNLTKTSILGAILAKNGQFWVKPPYISEATTDPFLPFEADLFVYLKQIGVQIIE